jgi:hypothetical protein
MEPLNVTIALGMVVGRAPVRDAQLIQSLDIACRRKLRASDLFACGALACRGKVN